MEIKEDFVSFETAKLLKEKGFDAPCFVYYYVLPHRTITAYDADFPKNSDLCLIYANMGFSSLPTLQMAMKWLREVHNIFICILPSEVGAGVMDYTYVLYKIDAKNFYFEDLSIQGRANNISEISYEQAVEAAIKYCLKKLI